METDTTQMKSATAPAFSLSASPMQRVETTEGGQSVNMEGTTTAAGLRVRSRPGVEFPEISAPLVRGTRVHVSARENGWYKINENRWVYAQYVNTTGTEAPLMSEPARGVETELVIVVDPAQITALEAAQVPDFAGTTTPEGITGSVGKGGTNAAADVATVQSLLNNAGAGIRVTGVADRVLEGAIFMYQKGRTGSGDGRVDAGGGTWRALVAGEFQFSSITGFELPKEDLAPGGIPRQDDVEATYGDVDNIPLVRATVPFPLYYDGSPMTSVRLHRDVAASFTAAMGDILSHYGLEEIERLRINHNYGGTYNKRKMRGGTSWSMHAYGIAIDLNAAENGLRTTAAAALFAKPEYQAMIDIMERHGWYSLGRAKNYDYMHFQVAFPV